MKCQDTKIISTHMTPSNEKSGHWKTSNQNIRTQSVQSQLTVMLTGEGAGLTSHQKYVCKICLQQRRPDNKHIKTHIRHEGSESGLVCPDSLIDVVYKCRAPPPHGLTNQIILWGPSADQILLKWFQSQSASCSNSISSSSSSGSSSSSISSCN